MATVSFLYRSKKEEAPLNLRLLFRHDKKDYQIGGKIKLEVKKEEWKKINGTKKISDPVLENLQLDVKKELNKISRFILDHFNNTTPDNVDKVWLKNVIQEHYNPNKEVPTGLIDFIDYFLELKDADFKESKKKRIKTTRNKLIRLEGFLNKNLLIKDINEQFKSDLIRFSEAHQYSQNTQQRDLARIKTICNEANYLGVEVSPQLSRLRMKRERISHVYLTFDELDIIKGKTFKNDYLDNARDWLIVSCFTGQRVSDFMRFTKDNIRKEGDKKLIEFRQVKTDKLMTIPLAKEVQEVLKKRDGNFPRPISAQKYNDYIKEVCKSCGFDEPTKGKKRICIADDEVKATKYDYRDVTGIYPKYDLITSHVGRRSFATNYYGKVPTAYLIGITGHSTEKMFLNYIKKSNKDLALDAYKYFG